MTTASYLPAAGRLHRPLLVTAILMAVLAVFCSAAMAFDDRMLLNESVWLKPMKFAIAFTLYAGTLSWLLSFPHKGKRLTWWMGMIFSLTAIVDVGFIVVQAARGTFSHFNDQDDAVNTIGQQIFQSGVPGLFVANLVIALVLSWQRITDRPTSRAIHAGLGIAVAGMVLGYFMGFTGKQQVTDAYGRPVELVAGHTVVEGRPAVRDGVDGMPVTHWSAHGGDLRIAHFLGLHGIQFLILAAVALAWFAPRVPWLRAERARADLIWVLALGYSGLLAITFWQALRGQAVTAPDAVTVWALAAVCGFVAAGCGLVYAVRGRAALVPSLADARHTDAAQADTQAEFSAAAPRPGSASPMSR
ncbi:hypothetical protein [Nocardia huaxiensis]|uniref:Uncharacterized protein n=1 Tax=Nocardia huaxiensis TaxID=2755382 RepID=A0A7D6ZKP8_9NOCA|nr:hypothetical protein [Nocardia huaxiensis]QLY27945.1 hypothetical protein H0264_21230 [Nocardia huaxiensis]UFS98644.1 hypothetical protein LPY97_12460 [Nocardia huaxiensis]